MGREEDMKRLSIAVAIVAASTVQAAAQIDIMKMQVANGLAETIKASKHCNFRIDQDELENYYTKAGLDAPEILSFISSSIALSEFDDKPDASSCTMAKMTARKIGILEE